MTDVHPDVSAIRDVTPFRVGERFSRELRFSTSDIRTFAALAGDTNPLHSDAAFATRSRFRGLIASGTHTSALIMGVVAAHMAARGNCVGLNVSCEFRRAVPAEACLQVVWTVASIAYDPRLRGEVIALEGVLSDDEGNVFALGSSKTLYIGPAG